MTILAGFDIGTTAVKGVYFDVGTGSVVAESTFGYTAQRPAEGWVEQDPADWLRGVTVCASSLRTQAPGVAPEAVGLCSQVNTHVFVDAGLRPVRPAIGWQDQRCADAARELDRRAGDRKEMIFGGPFSVDASFALSRALWLQQHDPEAWAATRWILSPKDYCLAILTSQLVSDRISPVGLVGQDGTYLAEALALVDGAANRFPRLDDFDARAGVTTGHLGLAPDLPVGVGTMDAWSSIYGSGVVAPGQGVEISGTSEVIGIMSGAPGRADGIISFPPVRGRYLHAGPTQAGGEALRWIAALLGMPVERALREAGHANASPPALVFLPHLAGERAPVWNADARAVFLGMSASTTPGDLVLCVLEGVAHAARQLREACEVAAGRPVARLRLAGGGTRSELWNQIKSDAHRRPLDQVAGAAAGCIGAALMGGVAAGFADDLEAWAASCVSVARTYTPDAGRADRFDELHDVYRTTYDALVPRFVELAARSRRVR